MVDSSLSLPSSQHSERQLAGFLHIFDDGQSHQLNSGNIFTSRFHAASTHNSTEKGDSHRIPIYANDAFFVGRNPELW
jgi:hypothetical protein